MGTVRGCVHVIPLDTQPTLHPMPSAKYARSGFDHGVGHSLLLLYDAKASHGKNGKEFKDLGHDPSDTSISLFKIITKYFIFITI